jgi:hypothetical protein
MADVAAEHIYKFKSDYVADWDLHRQYIQDFDAYEAMLMGQVYDSVSRRIDGAKITDSYATTLAKERADRVIAKLPEGVVEPIGKSDVGKAAFMDILRQKWIYPNANAQHSFLEKLNMWQLYSSVYGYMPMFYDWNFSPGGYVGPDCWLWSPRNLIPQQGRISIDDMEYVTALSWVTRTFLQDKLDDEDGGWDHDALRLLIQHVDDVTNADQEQDTKVSRERTASMGLKKGICLATRYEAGEDGMWTTFAPDYGCIQVRSIANPHKNGRIPFVVKYSQPLFDSFYGLGDFQRAKPLQFARDGLINFYFKGIKMNLIPPVVANANGVLKHTLDYREGAVMLETIPNSIRRLETSSAGLATYQAAQSNLTGSLLSLYGSQNASIPGADSLNPSQGKTPQAIDFYSDKEATRDGAERRHLEDAIQKLTTGFFSLVANIGTEEVPVALFQDDIQDILDSGLTDIKDLFTSQNLETNQSDTAAVLKVKPGSLKGTEFRFRINPNSTALENKKQQLAMLKDWIDVMGKYQNVIESDPTVQIQWGEMMMAYEKLSGIKGASKFVKIDPNATPPEPPKPTASATAVQTPGGTVQESADLVKFYTAVADPSVQDQIIKALGFQPSGPTPQTVSTGHQFQNPHIAEAAQSIIDQTEPSPMPDPQQMHDNVHKSRELDIKEKQATAKPAPAK